MNVSFTGTCQLEVEVVEGAQRHKHVRTDIMLEVSKNLVADAYLDPVNMLKEPGCKALTNVFIQGLVANIHLANELGYWKDADHIRFIIEELEKGFVAIPKISQSYFEE